MLSGVKKRTIMIFPQFEEAIKESFSTIVDKISVEIVDENEDSIIEMEIKLYGI